MSRKRTSVGSPERMELSDAVLDGMKNGLSCFKACEAVNLPNSTFMLWLSQDTHLAERYACARQDLLEKMAQETLEIADMAFIEIEEEALDAEGNKITLKKKIPMDVNRARLMVDTRKWHLSKLAPKKYGDRLELTGDVDNPIALQAIERVIVKNG
jgi:hypothetical protein